MKSNKFENERRKKSPATAIHFIRSSGKVAVSNKK
jgi:hypothetical protein